MGKIINIKGEIFGDLTVIDSAGLSSDKKALWLCKCSCGNTRIVRGVDLRSGKISNCGCKRKTTIKNLQGQKFGRLTVIEEAGRDNNGKVLWRAKCDCGKETIVRGGDLSKGAIVSCGCYKTEKLSKDLTGQRFGLLTVIKKLSKKERQLTWLCECDCGNEIEVTTNHLVTGNTQSCGCLVSKGENQIALLLNKEKIPFKQQFTFNNLLGKNKNPLRFDFALFKNDILFCVIEFQGIQHYKNVYNLPEEEYTYTLKRDELKKQYCIKNNIVLIEIKYDENINQKMGEVIKWYYDKL